MNIDFTQPHPPDGPVLALDRVSVPLLPQFDVGLEEASLVLPRGELAVLLLEKGVTDYPLADVVSGLVGTESGTLKIFGGEWSSWNADEQARARWRIGRVFEGHGWMSNLDVDENVTLAERYHSARPWPEILEEAERWAKMAGLEGLPSGRPAVAERQLLRRAEWVRAVLGDPWFLLLERPGRDLAEGWIDDLLPLVETARARGAAVVWLCEGRREWNHPALKPSLKLAAEKNTLRAE
jgi:ABC-type transporter Mla maintaining outer membrane lipid asymmetry ATPase subunit MlaF